MNIEFRLRIFTNGHGYAKSRYVIQRNEELAFFRGYFDIHNPIEEEVSSGNIEQLVTPLDRLKFRRDMVHQDTNQMMMLDQIHRDILLLLLKTRNLLLMIFQDDEQMNLKIVDEFLGNFNRG